MQLKSVVVTKCRHASFCDPVVVDDGKGGDFVDDDGSGGEHDEDNDDYDDS